MMEIFHPADVVCVASWNADLTSRITRPLLRGETLMSAAFSISPGGKGSNAAVAAARQGASVAVIARIGSDDFGDMGMALWKAEGIATDHVERASGERSGVAQIMVYEDGDNSIAVYPGAGAGLTAGHAGKARDLLENCKVLMASCEVPFEASMAAFRVARQAGGTTLLNPAPARPLSPEMLALVDVMTPNKNELLALAGNGLTLDQAAETLMARGPRALIVTLGAEGCRLYRRGHRSLDIPARRVVVADTIGAGDTFTGALAAALARGEDMDVAAKWANATAGLSVSKHGAVNGIPTHAEVAAACQDGDS